ncbi:hypothetical protein BDAP_000858 [Binucleata daphniae]
MNKKWLWKHVIILYVLFIPYATCLRVVQLKDSDKYLINNSGILSEEAATINSIENQYVVIHNRILYFYKDNKYFTLAQPSKDITVKIVESSFHTDRNIEFLENRTVVDAFSLGIDNKDNVNAQIVKQSQTRHETDKNKRALPLRHPRLQNTQRLTENKYLMEQRDSLKHKDQKNIDIVDYGLNEHTLETQKRKESDYNLDADEINDQVEAKISHTSDIEKNPQREYANSNSHNKHFLDDETLPTDEVKKKKDFAHLIESDSSMDETIDGCLFKDVIVQEIDGDYFQLVANKNICVTLYDSKFIFASCSKKNDKQQFTMVRADELLKKIKNTMKVDTKSQSQDSINLLKLDANKSTSETKFQPHENRTITTVKTELVPMTVTVTKKPETKTKSHEKPDDESNENENEKNKQNKKSKEESTSPLVVLPTVKTEKKKGADLNLDNFLTDAPNANEDDDFLSRMQSMFSLSDIGINNIE